ncbi:MAG: CsbD family protein [Gemmatimonadota bacterium]|nr:CsbD family protein [Gemmatimonadota bacterium]
MDDKTLGNRGAENQIKGTAKELEGKVRSKVGDAVDNDSESLKGRAKEAEGKVQKNFGKAERAVDDAT